MDLNRSNVCRRLQLTVISTSNRVRENDFSISSSTFTASSGFFLSFPVGATR